MSGKPGFTAQLSMTSSKGHLWPKKVKLVVGCACLLPSPCILDRVRPIGLHPRLLRRRLHVAALAVREAHDQVVAVDAGHRLPDVFGYLCQDLGAVVMGHGLDDGLRPLLGIRGLEDAAA